MHLIETLRQAGSRLRNLPLPTFLLQALKVREPKILPTPYQTRASVAHMLMDLPLQTMRVPLNFGRLGEPIARSVPVLGTIFEPIDHFLAEQGFIMSGTMGPVKDALEMTQAEMRRVFLEDDALLSVSTYVAGSQLLEFNEIVEEEFPPRGC